MSFLGKDKPVAARRHAGFALAVLVPALLVALSFTLLIGLDTPDLVLLAYVFLIALFLATVIIALAAICIGLPLTWLLEQRRLEPPWSYPLAGFVAGAALILLAPALAGELRGDTMFEFLPYAWIGALPGSACGAIWWWAYRRHMLDREDRDGRA